MRAYSFDYPLKIGLLTSLGDCLFGTNQPIGQSKSICKQLRSPKHYLKLVKSFSKYTEEIGFITKSQKREEKYYGA
ncbi:MAG: hypothetical protein C4291_11755 [Candidatus Dadabacteria bacterium]